MAKMESMVPHILRWEVGKTDYEMKNKVWEKLTPRGIYDRVKGRGYHCLANDKGGPTMCGVTLSTLTDWRRRQGRGAPTVAELKALGYDEWLAMLKGMFWDPCKADEIRNDSIAAMLVDWSWLNGPVAIKHAQTALGLKADGIIGPKTLALLNSLPSASVFERLKAARIASYDRIVAASPKQKVWYKGWVNRTNSIEYNG